MGGVHAIDLFVIIAYLILILAFGTFFRRYVRTSQDFFIAGKMLPWWVISMSIIGTNIGAYDYIGAAGGAYRFGIAQANYEWIGAIPAMIVSALLFVPYYWKAGVYTIPEYLEKRYNIYVRLVEALLWGLFLVALLGIFFWAAGLMLHTYLGWSIEFSIGLTALVVGIYTVTGGLAAVAMTDVIQLVVMFVGGMAVAILGFWEVGGWQGLVDRILPQHPDHLKLFLPLDNPQYPWLGMIFGLGLVLSPAWWCCNQSIIQRTLGARGEWDAKASMLFAAFPKTLIPILVVLPGFFALAFATQPGEITNPDQALPWVIKHLLPPGLAGLVFMAFIAALHSSVDSTLNSAATIWTRDIYQRFLIKEASDRHYLRVGRLLTAIFVLIGVILAPITQKFPGIYVAMQTLLSFFQGPTLATILLGVAWARATQWGGLVGLLGGVATSAILFSFKINFLYVAWWSFVSSLLINLVVSLLTKPEPLEKLQGLVYGLVFKDEQLQKNLRARIREE